MAKKTWFYGKNILISGTSSGIGFQLAKIFSSKYACNVIGTGIEENKLKKAKNEIQKTIENYILNNKKQIKYKGSFNYKVSDATSFEDWQKLKNELDDEGFQIDVLINNAGIMLPFDKFYNQNMEDVKRVFETNFFAHLYSYKTFIEDLLKVKGAIINISSSSALCPVAGATVYSASKAASKSFAETLLVEHKDDLYIAYVCPGYTATDLFRNEKELSKMVSKVSMPADEMATKIINKIKKKKTRIVIGKDAHFMSGLYRLSPKSTPGFINKYLKSTKDSMFDKI